MTYHIPLCLNCGNHEVQAPYTFGDGEGFCSQQCEKDANEGFEDGEPMGSHDLSDDGDALASAGFGTDEDYGYFGGEDF